MKKKQSVLIYCGDVLGLGHLRRNTAIASRLVREIPGTNVMLLSNLSSSFVFDCPPGVDVVKLPSLSKSLNGEFEARTLSVHQAQLKSVRVAVIDGLCRSFRPDMVLVDHLPVGVSGELSSTFDRLARSQDRPSLVLGLRDILDDPAITRKRWQDLGVYQAIERRYDSVLVYGSQRVFDTAQHYGLDTGLTTPVEHCGYVCAEAAGRAPRANRQDLGLGPDPLVVVTAGGGADGYAMMRLTLEALRTRPDQAKVQVVCITGPLMKRDQIEDLRARSADLPAEVLWCVDRVPAYFEAADLIVTMAGYNTMMESVRLKKRTVVLPRTGPSAEQTMRAELFAKLGLVHWLPADTSTPDDLAGLVARVLADATPAHGLPDMNGLDRVSARIRGILEDRAARLGLRAAEGGR